MQISWDDLNKPTAPGNYPWRDGVAQVDAHHIRMWQARPNALYNVTSYQPTTGPTRYMLGTANYDR
jgi:hypothetical protein